MTNTMTVGRIARTSAMLVASTLLAALPLLAHAQTDLSATIRAQLLSDPRTAGLDQAQLDAMVDLLAQQAQKQGITAQDLSWHPENSQTFGAGSSASAASDACTGIPTFACIFDEAFGFLGPDTTIPFSLGAASMGLIWILAEMIHRHRYPASFSKPAAPSSGM